MASSANVVESKQLLSESNEDPDVVADFEPGACKESMLVTTDSFEELEQEMDSSFDDRQMKESTTSTISEIQEELHDTTVPEDSASDDDKQKNDVNSGNTSSGSPYKKLRVKAWTKKVNKIVEERRSYYKERLILYRERQERREQREAEKLKIQRAQLEAARFQLEAAWAQVEATRAQTEAIQGLVQAIKDSNLQRREQLGLLGDLSANIQGFLARGYTRFP